jgi:hypothetical protein
LVKNMAMVTLQLFVQRTLEQDNAQCFEDNE